MFENMTARERKLATAVLCLVPAALLFMSVFWVIGKFGQNSQEYFRLQSAYSAENDRKDNANNAKLRRNYYNSISLSPVYEDAGNEYQIWLKTLLKETKLSYKTFTPRDVGEFKNNQVIGRKKKFSFTATGKLDQVIDFLTKFYSVDVLHRINSIKINPRNETSGGNKKVRTGELSVSFVIEVASLKTAGENPDFDKNVRQLPRSKDDYQSAIVRRNIFGPANNVPTVTARPSRSYQWMKDARINVTGKDADENDKLTFELVEGDVKEAKLDASPGKRYTKLTVPGQEAGEYKFKIKVTDSGFPPKENFADITVKFGEKPKPKVVETKKPKKPPFVHATETFITGITKLSSGDWQVWIKVQTTGEKYQLFEGESFELDKKEWVVDLIEPHSAVFLVDGKQLKINEGEKFDKPVKD